MLNPAAPDADVVDADVRARFYGVDVDAARLLATQPIYPLTAPGLPPPGAITVSEAVSLGDPLPLGFKENGRGKPRPPGVTARGKVKPHTEYGAYAHAVVRCALYGGLTLKVTGRDGPRQVSVIPSRRATDESTLLSGKGPAQCRMLVVGKHPGVEEARSGKLFSGSGSEPLWRAFNDAGAGPADLSQTMLTNLVRFCPPIKADNALPADWVRDGLHLLHQEIRLSNPTVVLVLGADAAKAVAGRGAKLTDLQNQVVDLRLDFRRCHSDPPDERVVKAVFSVHPAFVARDDTHYPQLLGAVSLALAVARGAATDEVVDYKAIYTEDELAAAVDADVAAHPLARNVAVDAEWHMRVAHDVGAYLYTAQWSCAPGEARVVFVRRRGGAPNMDPAVVGRHLSRLLTPAPGGTVRLLGHNVKADVPWLATTLNMPQLYDMLRVPDDDLTSTPSRFGTDKTRTEGPFDTLYAAHAVHETGVGGRFKLELLASALVGMRRYDAKVLAWKKEELTRLRQAAKANGMPRPSDLDGYGNMPEDLVVPYGGGDVDAVQRLFRHFNGVDGAPGALDADAYGNSSREAFWQNLKDLLVFVECETVGLLVDQPRVEELTAACQQRAGEILAELRAAVAWPEFNPDSVFHRRELLFGAELNGKGRQERPDGARSLGLQPIQASEAFGGKPWDQAVAKAEENGTDLPTPSADKTTLGILAPLDPLVGTLRDYLYLRQTLKTVMRPPTKVAQADGDADDEADGGTTVDVYEKGLLSYVNDDGRVRSMFFPIETGRLSSSKPNLTNWSSQRDADYERLLGDKFRPLRTVFVPSPRHLFVGADFSGAEIAMAGWLSDDPVLIRHAEQANLPKGDPDYLDLHADLAVRAFKLGCKPTKKALAEIGKAHLRTAAKRVRFGLYYGSGAVAAWRKAQEEDPSITLEEIEAVFEEHARTYPTLHTYFAACRKRVFEPGWIRTCFGRFRRFRPTGDRKLDGDQERQAMNVGMQSSVADALRVGMYNLSTYRDAHPVDYRVNLSIHDAVLLEVPYEHVDEVVETVLPTCMVAGVPVYPCDLDGVPTGKGPYRLGIDIEVMTAWGQRVTADECRRFGISARHAA